MKILEASTPEPSVLRIDKSKPAVHFYPWPFNTPVFNNATHYIVYEDGTVAGHPGDEWSLVKDSENVLCVLTNGEHAVCTLKAWEAA